VHLTFTGSAGQSFGAFNLPGMTMEVVGEVNDYVGKSIHGRVRIRLPRIWYLVFFQVFGIWYFSPGEDSG
jgi:hypothetical protein